MVNPRDIAGNTEEEEDLKALGSMPCFNSHSKERLKSFPVFQSSICADILVYEPSSHMHADQVCMLKTP